MGFTTAIIDWLAGNQSERTAVVNGEPGGLFSQLANTTAGVPVTVSSATTFNTVYSCIRIIAQAVSVMPAILYARSPDGGRTRAEDHSLWPILHRTPNDIQTPLEWKELTISHAVGWGNAYSWIDWSPGGQVLGLWPLHPAYMEIDVEWDGVKPRLAYRYHHPEVGSFVFPAWQIHHVKGLGDQIMGASVIKTVLMNDVGLAVALAEYGSRFFSNGARPSFVLNYPGVLDPEDLTIMREEWNETNAGLTNAHRVQVLQRGLTLEKIGIPPDEAQFLESRTFQKREIATAFGVPLHKLNDLEGATFSNIEHQALEFLSDTALPWVSRHEQAMMRDLMTAAEAREYLIEYLTDVLQRTDIETRYTAYGQAIQNAFMTPNEARRRENLNPVAGGDVLFFPLNMVAMPVRSSESGELRLVPPSGLLTGPAPAAENGGAGHGDDESGRAAVAAANGGAAGVERRSRTLAGRRAQLASDYRPLFEQAAQRVINREAADVGREAQRHFQSRTMASFQAWLDEFYRDHEAFLSDAFLPLLQSYSQRVIAELAAELATAEPMDAESLAAFIAEYLTSYTGRHIQQSKGQIVKAARDAADANESPADAVQARLDHWKSARAATISAQEAIQAGNAFAWAGYAAAGVAALRWVARGKSCPLCRGMDQVVVGIDEHFLKAGQEFAPEGAERPLTKSFSVRHPPLHGGCDCFIVAG